MRYQHKFNINAQEFVSSNNKIKFDSKTNLPIYKNPETGQHIILLETTKNLPLGYKEAIENRKKKL